MGSALANVRRLTTELRPLALDDFGLEPALERLAAQVAQRSSLRIQLSVSVPERTLASDQETAIYRIVREELTNSVKHRQATSVTVIEDDSVGLAVDEVSEGALGLVGMQERVTLLDGRLEIESAPGAGSTLVIELPA